MNKTYITIKQVFSTILPYYCLDHRVDLKSYSGTKVVRPTVQNKKWPNPKRSKIYLTWCSTYAPHTYIYLAGLWGTSIQKYHDQWSCRQHVKRGSQLSSCASPGDVLPEPKYLPSGKPPGTHVQCGTYKINVRVRINSQCRF